MRPRRMEVQPELALAHTMLTALQNCLCSPDSNPQKTNVIESLKRPPGGGSFFFQTPFCSI